MFASPFSKGDVPASMRQFFLYLEKQGVADVKLANHKVDRVAGQAQETTSYKISDNEPAVFRVTQTFATKAKPTLRNVAALIPSDMLKSSNHIRLVQQFVCAPHVCAGKSQSWHGECASQCLISMCLT